MIYDRKVMEYLKNTLKITDKEISHEDFVKKFKCHLINPQLETKEKRMNPNSSEEFRKFATKHMGISSLTLDKYTSAVPNVPLGMTSNIIEERQMNIAVMDVFSRLMMDRIIFLGTE